jgi:hypothetical protein
MFTEAVRTEEITRMILEEGSGCPPDEVPNTVLEFARGSQSWRSGLFPFPSPMQMHLMRFARDGNVGPS